MIRSDYKREVDMAGDIGEKIISEADDVGAKVMSGTDDVVAKVFTIVKSTRSWSAPGFDTGASREARSKSVTQQPASFDE